MHRSSVESETATISASWIHALLTISSLNSVRKTVASPSGLPKFCSEGDYENHSFVKRRYCPILGWAKNVGMMSGVQIASGSREIESADEDRNHAKRRRQARRTISMYSLNAKFTLPAIRSKRIAQVMPLHGASWYVIPECYPCAA